VRVYLPATTSVLRRLAETSETGPAPLTAFAVTPGLREWYVDDDVESLEYAAMLEAARASLRLLAADPAAAPRRVVIAAELPDAVVALGDDLDLGVVRVAEAVLLRQVVSVHVDDHDAEPAVRTATALIDAADLGDPDASDAVDDTEGFELAWYATQEIDTLLSSLTGSGEPSTG
jgi:Family of unknown function (DUF6912)